MRAEMGFITGWVPFPMELNRQSQSTEAEGSEHALLSTFLYPASISGDYYCYAGEGEEGCQRRAFAIASAEITVFTGRLSFVSPTDSVKASSSSSSSRSPSGPLRRSVTPGDLRSQRR